MTSERFVLSSALVDRLQQGGVDPYRNDPGGSATHGSSSPAAQLVNVVALLGLNRPCLDHVLGHRNAVDRTHALIVIRNSTDAGNVAVASVPGPLSGPRSGVRSPVARVGLGSRPSSRVRSRAPTLLLRVLWPGRLDPRPGPDRPRGSRVRDGLAYGAADRRYDRCSHGVLTLVAVDEVPSPRSPAGVA